MKQYLFLGLGSNLGDREAWLKRAMDNISKTVGTIDLVSSLYETEPWGFQSDNSFLNMVLGIHCRLKPEDLMKEILIIERLLGRSRKGGRYASRTIDIDILLYGNLVIDLPGLKIPHPFIHERKFVLVPLCEIAPEILHPVLHKKLGTLLKVCRDESKVTKVKMIS